jgi:hypothetical protein
MIATDKGAAAVMAALTIELLQDAPVRVVWHVDLKRHLGETASEAGDPSNPNDVDQAWGALLTRLRTALDNQPHKGQNCRVALMIDYTTRSSKTPVRLTFGLPHRMDLSLFLGLEPPIGHWYLLKEPPRIMSMDNEGDQLPDSFWSDGIPF